MRKLLLVICAVAFVVSGCVTVPPAASVGSAAMPTVWGTESRYSGYGTHGAHEWTDDDARTALWFRRNLPERWGEVPFTVVSLLSYNIHHDRQQFMPFEWEYYFADMRDPYLQVRMYTVEARDRNRTKRNEVMMREAADKAAADKAVTGEVSELSNKQVLEELHTVFP